MTLTKGMLVRTTYQGAALIARVVRVKRDGTVTIRVWDIKQAVRAAHELREEYPTCPRGRGSVIGGTDTHLEILYSLDQLPTETTERPRYE